MSKRGPYKSDEEKAATRRAHNARRRAARAADPTYRERARAYQKAFEIRHRERELVRKREWHRANKHVRRAAKHRRRALERGAAGHHTAAQLDALLDAQGGRCAYCETEHGLQVDHATPLSRGGSNWIWNLQFLCGPCNMAKGASTDPEHREAAGLPPAVAIGRRLLAIGLGFAV